MVRGKQKKGDNWSAPVAKVHTYSLQDMFHQEEWSKKCLKLANGDYCGAPLLLRPGHRNRKEWLFFSSFAALFNCGALGAIEEKRRNLSAFIRSPFILGSFSLNNHSHSYFAQTSFVCVCVPIYTKQVKMPSIVLNFSLSYIRVTGEKSSAGQFY